MFAIPIWAIVLICLSPFIITFVVSLVIGFARAKKKKKKDEQNDDR